MCEELGKHKQTNYKYVEFKNKNCKLDKISAKSTNLFLLIDAIWSQCVQFLYPETFPRDPLVF